jgi:hypothetical protein
MSADVKCAAADPASDQGSCVDVGDGLLELDVGVAARDNWLGRGWARGAQLSVYIVRRGIS